MLSYLKNASQRVSLKTFGSWEKIIAGIPQNAILYS